MEYKRLEIYLWWTCNHKCVFCVEFPTMEKMWDVKVANAEVLKKLIAYKKKWYNHVTYLWGEPFIQKNFWFALKVWKKLGYTILVTTNANTIQFEHIAKKFLPYIDQLIISVPIIDKELQPIINNTHVLIDFEAVFKNIAKYWKWNFLKINTVINAYNYKALIGILDFLKDKNISEISFTYPDIYRNYYSKKHITTKMARPYSEYAPEVMKAFDYGKSLWMIVKIVDFPFCTIDQKYHPFTDDMYYQERTKIDYKNQELNRPNTWKNHNEKSQMEKTKKKLPRMRQLVDKCTSCKYNNICWGPSSRYEELFWLDEINPVKDL